MRGWFEQQFEAPSRVQALGWPRIAESQHALLAAPTGSGKTLAAFLWAIDRLVREPPEAPGVRVLYVSPLKALAADIERNLRMPLEAVARAAEGRGAELRLPRVALRTGDTSARDRRQQARDPAEILVTTPESLYLILGSQQRETLATVETVIVDEIHALAPTKRGVHLALSLERLCALTARHGVDPQRIGLSATARPLKDVAAFLGGARPVTIVDALEPPKLDLSVRAVAWDEIAESALAEIRGHQSSLVFCNSRGLCERLARQINEAAGEELARAHHGSVAWEERREIETALAEGRLPAIVATHSLELGIDMQAVDCVLLVESPGSVARGLQRVGRAGHRVGEASRGVFHPKHAGDLLEVAAVVRGMHGGEVEALTVPSQPLDVLAQQIVALCTVQSVTLPALEELLHRSWSYRKLSREVLVGVLDMLSGRYPSTDFAELRARIRWDRRTDRLEAVQGSRLLALVSGGTIPDRGLYPVQRGEGGPRVGELDEEMVHEMRPGEVITLGASSWRVEQITRDRVFVSPAPGELGRLPFWRGEGPGRPLELGRALGALVRELAEVCDASGGLEAGNSAGQAWLRENCHFDADAAAMLLGHLAEQRRVAGALPTDRSITVERFRDEVGDWRVCILTPFGARLHAPWALALEARLSADRGVAVQALWSDDGIALRFPEAEGEGAGLPPLARLLPDPDTAEVEVVEQLADSALFAGQFRENAARALLLPRRRPGSRTPLWNQRLRAQSLLAVARDYPAFPILLETYRSCLRDVFDVPAWLDLLREIRSGAVAVHEVETRRASPFARSLIHAYTASYLYQGDTPIAERRARALHLDRALLRDLLGGEALRDLLDAKAIDATEVELQGLQPQARVRGPDALHDLLRRAGELSPAEVALRCEGGRESAVRWLALLDAGGRAVRIELAGAERWIAAEDAGLYRSAFGVVLPESVPEPFQQFVDGALDQWLMRFAACRGPFQSEVAAKRCGVAETTLDEALSELARRERLETGALDPRRPGDGAPDWCHPEVLRRLRRRSLAALRGEVAPVGAADFCRFQLQWQGVLAPTRVRGSEAGEARLRTALASIEGFPLSIAELERAVLPARVPGYDPRWLDALGANGEFVWIGCGTLGARDLRLRIYRRDRVAQLAEAPLQVAELKPLAGRVLEQLEQRGACFTAELLDVVGIGEQAELFGALRELAAAGLVSNDRFAALRTLARGRPPRPARTARRGRRGARSQPLAVGRWSAVSRMFPASSTPEDLTRNLHARAVLWLERYGIVSRELAGLEEVPGGFAPLYPVYREMERAGKLRGGHFVEVLPGAQFAVAGAVDRLRSARRASGVTLLLAATDPANPYGAQLPWPAREGLAAPRRGVGASVVIHDGELALYVDGGGRRAQNFGPAAHREAAAGALRGLLRPGGRASLYLEQIDGEPARSSPSAQAFLAAGFHLDYRGLVLERSGDPDDVI